MKSAKELYPGYSWYDYKPMIEEFGRVAFMISDGGYQGDSWVLYDDYNYIFSERTGKYRVGYLEFGWGSCSGCDALQACETISEVQELLDELKTQIKWFDGYDEALEWFENHDWEGDWSWGTPASRAFVGMAKVYLTWKANTKGA